MYFFFNIPAQLDLMYYLNTSFKSLASVFLHKVLKILLKTSTFVCIFLFWGLWDLSAPDQRHDSEGTGSEPRDHQGTPWHPAAVQLPSRVQLFVTPWTAARQASLSLIISRRLPKFMSIASVMPSSQLIL